MVRTLPGKYKQVSPTERVCAIYNLAEKGDGGTTSNKRGNGDTLVEVGGQGKSAVAAAI